MNDVIPFKFGSASIRVVQIDDEPWFVGKDVAEVLGYVNSADAIAKHCKGVAKRYPLQTAGGAQDMRVLSEADMLRLVVNSGLPAAEKFERWVFEEVLPSIRKTGGYQAPSMPAAASPAVEALKMAPLAVRAYKAFGLDKNAASIAANQFVRRCTNVNLLSDAGHTHLKAENQEAAYFSPTELGKRIEVSGQALNRLLEKTGLQVKTKDGAWEATVAGKAFSRIYDTGKKHSSGVPVQQVKWSAEVLSVLVEGEKA